MEPTSPLTHPRRFAALLLFPLVVIACGDDGGATPDAGPMLDRGLSSDLGSPDLNPGTGDVLCSEECRFSNDGECDDGGEGSLTSECALGTDCLDCGPRSEAGPEPGCTSSLDCAPGERCTATGCVPDDAEPEMLCSEECRFSNDGECDDGGEGSLTSSCAFGTDCLDCGAREGTPATCDPDAPPRCEGNSVVFCRVEGGEPAVTVSACDAGQRCEAGQCMGGGGTCHSPRCEGNVAVTCELVSGSPVSQREDCGSATCTDGACMSETMPDAVTIRANFGAGVPTSAGSATLLLLRGVPSFTPNISTLPNILDTQPNRATPDPGACELTGARPFGTVLSRADVGVMVNGIGPDCRDYITSLTGGLTLEWDDAPLMGGGGTIDVRLELRP
ncbi:MAG: hypothetical protein AAF938_19685 [Myxococcota bacterium]